MLILKTIFGFLLGNLKHIAIIAAIALAGVALYTYNKTLSDYAEVKVELDKTKGDLETAEKNYKTLRQDFNTYKGNVEVLDDIDKAKTKINQRQTSVKEAIRDVEVQNDDKFFARDPGLLDRARILREYQLSELSRDPTTRVVRPPSDN